MNEFDKACLVRATLLNQRPVPLPVVDWSKLSVDGLGAVVCFGGLRDDLARAWLYGKARGYGRFVLIPALVWPELPCVETHPATMAACWTRGSWEFTRRYRFQDAWGLHAALQELLRA